MAPIIAPVAASRVVDYRFRLFLLHLDRRKRFRDLPITPDKLLG
jgi:hypothetical protein